MSIHDIAAKKLWATDEATLQVILDVAARVNDSLDAVAAKLGRPLQNTYSATVRDGVAILPVDGPLFRHANLFTEISGATSVDLLAQDFAQALENPAVIAILLDVNSPGGEVDGVNGFAKQIAAARGKKPIAAYVSYLGASGAYWIASAAPLVVVDDVAHLGSIGVVATITDSTEAMKAKGLRKIEFVSSLSPNKRPDLDSEAGRQEVQRTVDAVAQVFVDAVARNRGVSPDKVLADFGRGGVHIGAAAVAAGMADRVGTFEELLAELSGGSAGASRSFFAATASAGQHAQTQTEDSMNGKDAGKTGEKNPEAQVEAKSQDQAGKQAETNVVDLNAVRSTATQEGRAAAQAHAAEVFTACEQAGALGLKDAQSFAAGFIAKATPVADVRKDLMDRLAAQNEALAVSGQHAGGAKSSENAEAAGIVARALALAAEQGLAPAVKQ